MPKFFFRGREAMKSKEYNKNTKTTDAKKIFSTIFSIAPANKNDARNKAHRCKNDCTQAKIQEERSSPNANFRITSHNKNETPNPIKTKFVFKATAIR